MSTDGTETRLVYEYSITSTGSVELAIANSTGEGCPFVLREDEHRTCLVFGVANADQTVGPCNLDAATATACRPRRLDEKGFLEEIRCEKCHTDFVQP